jgi:hypothetical protein
MTPEIDPTRPVRRSDWRTALAWHQQFQQYPVACLLLTLLCVLAAAALAFGWVGSSTVRPSERFRTWAGVVLWLAVGGYFAVCSVLGFRARGG